MLQLKIRNKYKAKVFLCWEKIILSIAVLMCRIVIIGTYSKASIQVMISASVRAFVLIVHRTDMDVKVFGREKG